MIVFHRDADANVPSAIGRDVASRIPDYTATFVPGAGHMWFVDHTDEILALVSAPDR